MNAVAAAAGAVSANRSAVFADDAGIDRNAAQIAALIDPAFLAEAGWDEVRLVLSPPAEHPLLGRPVCRAQGCSTTATNRVRICASCRRRLAVHGLGEDELAALPARARERSGRGPQACAVVGCGRQWASSRSALCRAHLDVQQALGISVEQFCAHP